MPDVDRECITHHICDCQAAWMAELEQRCARLRADLDTANERVHYWRRHFYQVNNDNGRLRLELAAEREKRQQAEQERDELRRIVYAETPIAALDLATTWRAERAMLQEQLAEAERERDAASIRVALDQARQAKGK